MKIPHAGHVTTEEVLDEMLTKKELFLVDESIAHSAGVAN